MIEVEIKLPISNPDLIEKKLLEDGFEKSSFIREQDTYFDNAREEIRRSGTALRVRETKDLLTGQTWAQLNYKGKKMDTQTMTRRELETGVENGAVCREILQALGYSSENSEVVKERKMLRKDSATACLDRVHGLGSFLELEILVEDDVQRKAALERIEQILGGLGYRISDTVQNSYLSMLQKKQEQTGSQSS